MLLAIDDATALGPNPVQSVQTFVARKSSSRGTPDATRARPTPALRRKKRRGFVCLW